jgi:hypothetical protein
MLLLSFVMQLDAGAHRQRDSRRSSSSVAAAAAAKAGQLRCDEQQLLTASSDELGEMQDSEEADRAAHLRFMRRLQQIQQQRHGTAAAAGAAEVSGGSSDSAKRKRASPDSAGADTPAAAAGPAAAAAGEHAHRSKRKRHMTSRAAEAAAAGLIPTAGLSPEEALAATAAHSALLQMQQQQPKVLGRGPAAAAAAAAFGGDDLSRQIHTEVQMLSSIDKATVMEALERLFRLLASLLVSDDERAGDALTLALQGLLGLLRNSSSSSTGFGAGSSSSRDGGGWSDLQLTALAVLDTLARQEAAYRECVVACGAPVVLVRLVEGAGSAAVQLAAVQALQALLQHGDISTVEAVADAHGVEVLLLAVARGRAGSALRQAAAGCLCSMAAVHPDHADVAVAAAGVRYMAAAAGAGASSSRA